MPCSTAEPGHSQIEPGASAGASHEHPPPSRMLLLCSTCHAALPHPLVFHTSAGPAPFLCCWRVEGTLQRGAQPTTGEGWGVHGWAPPPPRAAGGPRVRLQEAQPSLANHWPISARLSVHRWSRAASPSPCGCSGGVQRRGGGVVSVVGRQPGAARHWPRRQCCGSRSEARGRSRSWLAAVCRRPRLPALLPPLPLLLGN